MRAAGVKYSILVPKDFLLWVKSRVNVLKIKKVRGGLRVSQERQGQGSLDQRGRGGRGRLAAGHRVPRQEVWKSEAISHSSFLKK